jgi:hypothetical protein
MWKLFVVGPEGKNAIERCGENHRLVQIDGPMPRSDADNPFQRQI